MSHDNHFNFEVNKSLRNGKQKSRTKQKSVTKQKRRKHKGFKRQKSRNHRRGGKGGLTMRWVAFENKSKCLYVLGMSQVWVRFAIC